jgi:carbon-monoxide dehydrogenase iron sulfur subunit
MKIIVTDYRKCVGCHSCEIACAISKSKSQTLLEAILEEPRPASRVRVVPVQHHAIPMQCSQCEDAPCIAVCPTKALYRLTPEDPVLFQKAVCIGCSSCVLVCPFGAIRKAPGGIMAKCDLCITRLEEGKQPACVEACPTGARQLVPADRVAEDKLRKMASAISQQEFGEEKGSGSPEKTVLQVVA